MRGIVKQIVQKIEILGWQSPMESLGSGNSRLFDENCEFIICLNIEAVNRHYLKTRYASLIN